MLPLFNLAAVLASFILAVNASPVQLAPDVGNIFAVYPGWDMTNLNGGINPILGLSEQGCMQACSASTFPDHLHSSGRIITISSR